ncbi:unnamed protein product [Bursaphelenchus okinawaensis]|uniref:Uncharacterized protein n=1 Tax=Bursaphelenchus okinawaensis TaxID=465554 RepID=A0A811LQ51_9BILA|nr:unnamed protein product [Bursaphelenchus okinawaensis]CAG9126235.1 unnamed protein product [Bursaphelenchus okinawaensis]
MNKVALLGLLCFYGLIHTTIAEDPKLCVSNVCFNGGICIVEKGDNNDSPTFQCECPAGFTGTLCEEQLDCNLKCKKNGICKFHNGSPEPFCACPEGFSGLLCDKEADCQQSGCPEEQVCLMDLTLYRFSCESDLCHSNPCHHNATCRPIKDDFLCECAKGLRGRLCDEDVDECEEEAMPCLNRGVCENILGGYNCKCPIGFEGKICEQRVGECVQKPCVHGNCVDIEAGFRCDCNEGFEGRLCDKEAECKVKGRDCLNGGVCVKNGTLAHCECPEPFQGEFCDRLQLATEEEEISSTNNVVSTTISGCNCQNGGVCSSNDVCECPSNFVGPQCQVKCNCMDTQVCHVAPSEVGFQCTTVEGSVDNVPVIPDIAQSGVAVVPLFNISSCEECTNSEKCVVSNQQHLCLCHPNYKGSYCSERSNVCESVSCPHRQQCRLRRTSQTDVPYCTCPSGFTGDDCSHKIDDANFNNSSVVVVQVSGEDTKHWIQFTFRTTVTNVHIMTGESILNDFSYSIGLHDGYVYFSLKDQPKQLVQDTKVNDGDWYQVTLVGTGNGTVIEVAHFETGYVLGHLQLSANKFDIFSVRFGRFDRDNYFVGCVRNIMVNGRTIDVFSKQRSIDVGRGCQRETQCRPDTCAHGGRCIDHWSYHQCECRRPYLEPDCSHRLSESTFGHDNLTSLAEYVGDADTSGRLSKATDVSFIIRTNRDVGQVFYLGQTSDDDTATFLSGRLANGSFEVDSRLGGRKVFALKGNTVIADNENHIVTVERRGNTVELYVDGKIDGSLKIDRPFEHPLLVDKFILGGNMSQYDNDTSIFKGTLQDVRINGDSVILNKHESELARSSLPMTMVENQNLLEGTVSDEICATSTPCVNGRCTDTFNDFECECSAGYMGKKCDMRDYCSTQPCPTNSECLNTHGGYVCKSPATFATTSHAEFVLQGNDTVDVAFDLTFSLRTRSEKARILTLRLRNDTMFMKIDGRGVNFGLKTNDGVVNDTVRTDVVDGQWHSVNLFVKNKQLYANFDNMSSIKIFRDFRWEYDVKDDFDSVVFGKDGSDGSFKGCLHNVKLSSYPYVTFFGAEGSGFIEGSHLVASKLINIRPDGCHSKSLCDSNPCKNGALCKDLFDKQSCECAKGFEGEFCEINVNECNGVTDCGENGVCVDDIATFKCQCKKGFSGARCEAPVDFCTKNPCKNGGTCSNVKHGYECKCTEAFIGQNCTVKRDTQCATRPCKNDAQCQDSEMGPQCDCQVGFSGDLCEVSLGDIACLDMPCRNGGKCKTTYKNSTTYFCDCPSEFEGDHCEVPKDHCKPSSCKHGVCRSIFNDFMCSCKEGWEGLRCDRDVNECLEHFPCENNGSCVNTEGGFNCVCPQYYFGERCETAGICTTSPCQHGKCIQNGQNNYTCECKKGYEGVNCDVEIDYCKTEPCQNGGTCKRMIGGFVCSCIAGFTGEKCETDIDDCAGGNKCANGGKCMDRVNGFECNCRGTGYKGTQCQEDINECDEEGLNCVNGHCENLPGSYYCHCKENFIGSKCNMVNPCTIPNTNKTLHNCVHGECVNPRVTTNASGRELSQYECKCHNGYTGPQCIQMVEKAKSVSLGYIIGPSLVLLVVCAIMVCMLFYFVAKNRRANQGTYSPSNQEMTGARVQMHQIQKPIKKQERLI